jgi:Bardet-Biedl syndrome 2 protein
MLVPTFSFELGHPVVSSLFVIGKFDGEYPSLVVADSADHLKIHCPHLRHGDTKVAPVRELSVNRVITAVGVGQIDPLDEAGREVLFVGTSTNLLAYDVENNADVFYKDITDGVSAIAMTTLPSTKASHSGSGLVSDAPPVVLAGGNCSIQGFDDLGNEHFWTVTDENVTAIGTWNSNTSNTNQQQQQQQQQQQLHHQSRAGWFLVGMESGEIRTHDHEDIVGEQAEHAKVIQLVALKENSFGYALSSGTIGVYDNGVRLWHAKAQHDIAGIACIDINQDGIPELAVAWSDGTVEIRNAATGEVVYKDVLPGPAVAITTGDYRMDGTTQLLCCTKDGVIRGYLQTTSNTDEHSDDLIELQTTVNSLRDRRHALLAELKQYETLAKNSKTLRAGRTQNDWDVDLQLTADLNAKQMVLHVNTTSDAFVKSCIVSSEEWIEDSQLAEFSSNPSSSLSIALMPPKDVPTTLTVKATVGDKKSSQLHVVTIKQDFPRFASYVVVARSRNEQTPDSYVSFETFEKPSRIASWITSAFNMSRSEINAMHNQQDTDGLTASFFSVRDGSMLAIRMKLLQPHYTVTIHTKHIELAAAIVTEMSHAIGVDELTSTADFPHTMEQLAELCERIEEHSQTRRQLAGDMAESINTVKTVAVKAEDARLLGNMRTMKRQYTAMLNINAELLSEYRKHETNHSALVSDLKKLNTLIQHFAEIRVGKAKRRVVSQCRKAIKTRQFSTLAAIMCKGVKP